MSDQNQIGTYEITARDAASSARNGVLQTAHGPVETPVFMPVGTQATVKSMAPRELEELDCQILLGNTYHLNVRPGMEVIEACGRTAPVHGLGPGDPDRQRGLPGVQPGEAAENDARTGSGSSRMWTGPSMFLGPKESMAIQRTLGSDIAMVFDECPPCPVHPGIRLPSGGPHPILGGFMCRTAPCARGSWCSASCRAAVSRIAGALRQGAGGAWISMGMPSAGSAWASRRS